MEVFFQLAPGDRFLRFLDQRLDARDRVGDELADFWPIGGRDRPHRLAQARERAALAEEFDANRLDLAFALRLREQQGCSRDFALDLLDHVKLLETPRAAPVRPTRPLDETSEGSTPRRASR